MHVILQGSCRRIRLSKSEVAKLQSATDLCVELCKQTTDKDSANMGISGRNLLLRIDAKGNYSEPASEPQTGKHTEAAK